MTLERFVEAQAGTYDRALAELRTGRKTSHWMWFVFPQIAGLGRSETARYFAIADLDEARAYLAHPLLGPRLGEVTRAVATASGPAETILGPVDALKLRSSMTLFEAAANQPGGSEPAVAGPQPFRAALDRFFGGERDPETLKRLSGLLRGASNPDPNRRFGAGHHRSLVRATAYTVPRPTRNVGAASTRH